jgi:hypothetical protein
VLVGFLGNSVKPEARDGRVYILLAVPIFEISIILKLDL